MKKKVLMIIGLISLIASMQVPVYASPVVSEAQATFAVRAANIEYRYKSVEGKIYRRLYDLTNQKWIGEWVLCP